MHSRAVGEEPRALAAVIDRGHRLAGGGRGVTLSVSFGKERDVPLTVDRSNRAVSKSRKMFSLSLDGGPRVRIPSSRGAAGQSDETRKSAGGSGNLLINIDVPDVAAAIAFYTAAFGLTVMRRFGVDGAELDGWPVRLCLLQKPEGSVGAAESLRRYDRHWTPVHLDVVV